MDLFDQLQEPHELGLDWCRRVALFTLFRDQQLGNARLIPRRLAKEVSHA